MEGSRIGEASLSRNIYPILKGHDEVYINLTLECSLVTAAYQSEDNRKFWIQNHTFFINMKFELVINQ